ncbi:phenylacetate--CoA ligase family protein [Candidatus Uabimicrobium amorphum]|uniref:Coenzyme F390 synthetase n=1 Tax=Uabimicrobium amorphum TaxID=2596890 RepID=A0A5S9INC2_UABAM|nr:AMP-binding protein [Candidatus Uabimicrobium amorphum]BBM85039.1 coenzyme F390 synthetase [Candidatus Uabimicrobium amorphum]
MQQSKQEYLPRAELRKLQLDKLNVMLREILPRNAFYREKFGDQLQLSSFSELQNLPFTTKQELLENQKAYPPYGSILTYPVCDYVRFHQTSGSSGVPLKILDSAKDWQWFLECWRMIYHATGVREDDVAFFAFSFGPFIGFWAGFEGAQSLGLRCIAGGGMSSVARLRAILDNEATYLCCTPTYAMRLLQVARENNIDVASSKVRALVVAGEPGGAVGPLRETLSRGWNARVFDHTGMTEIGSLGIECVENPGYTHLLETECIPEIIHPETLEVLPFGEEGELVLTNLGRWGCPLIRYRTGDLAVLTDETCVCKRTFCRMVGGIKGRKDDMIFIRGNNVYPSAIENIVREFAEIEEFQVEIVNVKEMTEITIKVECEVAEIMEKLSEIIQNKLHFRVQVEVVSRGSLPRFEMKAKRFVFKNRK